MQFFKKHSYDMVKVLITQIGISLFSFMLYSGVGMISPSSSVSNPFKLVISIFSTGFFFALLYCSAWEWGGKDKIHIDNGKLKRDGFKGGKIALFASIPNLLLAITAFVCTLISLTTGGESILKVGAVCITIIQFIAMMYQGLIDVPFSFLKEVKHVLDDEGEVIREELHHTVESLFSTASGYLLFFILAIVAVQFGYFMGIREKKLFKFVKSKKKYE